ncbi:Flp pilus assembly protein CpaB [Pandoraea terrae]|uniref:Flp pilus assembly protein CpaB n=1 Tax=Pandoraea terrae TaxID=1537710 RepID=A0A5E4SQK7_9BURK|nr:Flp pilus assembly protein CpaB [Pandoraea terrae]VVD76618.1 Flp pilus assembly protein CpaB [Pandoraea terrae]
MSSLLRIAGLLIVAAIGAFVLRTLYVAASRPASSAPPAMDHVRAAAADLPQGLLLRDSDLAWRDFPHGQVPPGALVQSQDGGADLKGAVLRTSVSAGKPLGLADVIQPDAPGFLAAALKPGMRATSVAIDDVSGNAGLIQPGDYVDLLLTQQLDGTPGRPAPTDHSVAAETVVSRVRVLAVGSAFLRPKADAETKEQPKDAHQRARTVTFEVTPHTAQVIAVATHLGSLSLALRSFATSDRQQPAAGDEMEPQTPPVWASDVSRAVRTSSHGPAAAGGAARAPAPKVIVYRGSKVGDGTNTPAPPAGAAATPGSPPPTPAGQPQVAANPATQR